LPHDDNITAAARIGIKDLVVILLQFFGEEFLNFCGNLADIFLNEISSDVGCTGDDEKFLVGAPWKSAAFALITSVKSNGYESRLGEFLRIKSRHLVLAAAVWMSHHNRRITLFGVVARWFVNVGDNINAVDFVVDTLEFSYTSPKAFGVSVGPSSPYVCDFAVIIANVIIKVRKKRFIISALFVFVSMQIYGDFPGRKFHIWLVKFHEMKKKESC